MAITLEDFNKIWASTSPLTPYSFSDSQYKEGWNFIGSTPPSRQMWDFLQKQNDEKMQYLANNYLPLSGGTLIGDVLGVTPPNGDNSKKLATTGWVQKLLADALAKQKRVNQADWYNSVAEMRASETAIVGRPCVTLGYYKPNDGGGAVYIIRSKTDKDTDDGGSIITLDNGNVAEMLIEEVVNVRQFGAKGDGATDDTTAIQTSLNKYNRVYIPAGTYNTTGITLNGQQTLYGEGDKSIVSGINLTQDEYIITISQSARYATIKNLHVKGDRTCNGILLDGSRKNGDCSFTVENVTVENVNNGIKLNVGCSNCRILHNNIYNCNGHGLWMQNVADCRIIDNEIGMVQKNGYYLSDNTNSNLISMNKDFLCGLSSSDFYGIYIGTGNIVANHTSQAAGYSAVYIGSYSMLTGAVFSWNYKEGTDTSCIKGVSYGSNINVIVRNGLYKYGKYLLDTSRLQYYNNITIVYTQYSTDDAHTPEKLSYPFFSVPDNIIPNANKIRINNEEMYADHSTNISNTTTSTKNLAIRVRNNTTFEIITNVFHLIVSIQDIEKGSYIVTALTGPAPTTALNKTDKTFVVQMPTNSYGMIKAPLPVYGTLWG